MMLPIDTSAPTYRKMAAAPSRAQRDFRECSTESCAGAGGGAERLRRAENHQMNTARSAIMAAIDRKEVSMLRNEASRFAAASAAPAPAANTPPRNINIDPR